MAVAKSGTQSRAHELALASIESFSAEIRPMLRRDLDMFGKELKASLEKEFKTAIKNWNKHLQGSTCAGIRQIVKDELESALKSGAPVLAAVNVEAEIPVDKVPLNRQVSAPGRNVKSFPRGKAKKFKDSQGMRRKSLMHREPLMHHETDQCVVEAKSPLTGASAKSPNDESAALLGPSIANLENSHEPLLAEDRTEAIEDSRVSTLTMQEDPKDAPFISQDRMLEVIESEPFELAIAAIIFLNAIVIGASTQLEAQDPVNQDGALAPLDAVFFILFSVEIMMRLYAYRLSFFFSNSAWNLFDFSLVMLQLADMTTQSLPGSIMSLRALRAVRSLRMIRVLRLLRVFRLVRFVSEMRTIHSLIISSMRSLFGAMMLMALILYLFGICFTQSISDTRARLAHEGKTVDLETEILYGSLGGTMLCLYQSITGGLAWSEAVDVFSRSSLGYLVPVFSSYIFFCTFAMMNVVTGMLVAKALEVSNVEQDAVVVKNVNLVFNKGEPESTGDITWDEFHSLMQSPEMVDLFRILNVDASEAKTIFDLIDGGQLGIVNYSEFISGILRLRGSAKSVELAILMRDFSIMEAWTRQHLTSVEDKLKMVMDRLFPQEDLHEQEEEEKEGEGEAERGEMEFLPREAHDSVEPHPEATNEV